MISRREWLARLLGLMAAAGLTGYSHAEEKPENKVSKAVAKYQDHPNNMQMCGMCKFYLPAGGQAGTGMMGGGMGRMIGSGTCQIVAMMYGWWDGSSAPWYGMLFGPITRPLRMIAHTSKAIEEATNWRDVAEEQRLLPGFTWLTAIFPNDSVCARR